jgi:hypothetical protein
MNYVVVPHARNTGKGSTVMPRQSFSRLMQELTYSRLLMPGAPTWPDSVPPGLRREFSYDFLLTCCRPGAVRSWHGRLEESDGAGHAIEVRRLIDVVNRTLQTTVPT